MGHLAFRYCFLFVCLNFRNEGGHMMKALMKGKD